MPRPANKPKQPGSSILGTARPRIPAWLFALLLALLTIALYWPATGYDFISVDDPENFSENTVIQSGLSWQNTVWAFSTTHNSRGDSSWYPFTWLSFMLDASLFGKGPQGPHLTNLLLHAINGVLVFWLLWRATRAYWRSALVAALFALHPLRVQTVAWIADRRDLLPACFGILSLIFYARYAQKTGDGRQETGDGNKSPNHFLLSPYYWFALFFFACGLMSKPMLVTLPFVLLLLDYWPLQRFTIGSRLPTLDLRPGWRLLLEKVPFFALTGISCVITMIIYKNAGQLNPLAEIPLSARIENVFTAYVQYLGKTFWPLNLTIFHPYYQQHWPVPLAALAIALVLGICLAAVWLGRSRPYVFVGWFWFVGMLVPVIGLVHWLDLSICEHFTYLPLTGVFILLAWGAGAVSARWRPLKTALVVAAVLILCACALRTRDQLRHWQNSETLFRHALAVTENNYIAHNYLGNVLDRKGQTDEAILQYLAAIRLDPDCSEVHNNLAIALKKQGRTAEAIPQFREVLRLNPDYVAAHNDLGAALLKQGQLDEAIVQLQEALRLDPNYAKAHNNLGAALEKQGRTGGAIQQYREVIRLQPRDAEARYNLGVALLRSGQFDEAIIQLQEDLRLKPDDAKAYNNVGVAFSNQGRLGEAINQFHEALRLKPDYANARENLAKVLELQRQSNGQPANNSVKP